MDSKIIFSIIIVSSILTIGCKAPIQLSNIAITEHFSQSFDFSEIDSTQQVEFIGRMLNTKGVVNKFQKHINNDPEGAGKIKRFLQKNFLMIYLSILIK